MSQANIAHCTRENLRNGLAATKKELDNIDKARKAAIMTNVSNWRTAIFFHCATMSYILLVTCWILMQVVEDAKNLMNSHAGATFVIHEFKALSNAKVGLIAVFAD